MTIHEKDYEPEVGDKVKYLDTVVTNYPEEWGGTLTVTRKADRHGSVSIQNEDGQIIYEYAMFLEPVDEEQQ